MANYATREVIAAIFVPTLYWTPSQLTGVGIIPSRFSYKSVGKLGKAWCKGADI